MYIKDDLSQNSDSINRYLLYFGHDKLPCADVISFTAIEALSQPYRYVIRFTSLEKDLAPKRVLNNRAIFIMRSPNPKKFRGTEPAWTEMKQVNGVITAFSRLNDSSDESTYECVLEHELALFNKTRKSAVYLNIRVPDLVKKVILEHGEFDGYKVVLDGLKYDYPIREMIIQWQETDLAFIHRLLAEVGIWYRFENHPDVVGEVITFFSDSGNGYVFSNKALPYIRESGQTTSQEYATSLKEMYSVVSANVQVKNYNYRTPVSPEANKSIYLHDVSENIRSGYAYHYADNHLIKGGRDGKEAETATFNARVRHEYLLNDQTVLSASTNDPGIAPGHMIAITGDIPEGFKPGFVICRIEMRGSRAEQFVAQLSGIPYHQAYCFRPERQPRPVIAGTVPARISTRHVNGQYADTDLMGRYIVKFDFDREEKKKGYESAFVRLARPYAGDTYGFHFPLLDSTEVAIAFECGDPDRPFISHVLHDGAHPDLVTMRNDTRNVIRTPANNKIRLEDRRGAEHIKVSTEYGKTQLNVGHLVDAKGAVRGEGLEGRTDAWMALRAAKGIMLTTEAQPRAQGQQLDMTAAIAALQNALSLAMTLQQCATTAGAGAVATDQQAQLKDALEKLASPGLLAFASQGQAFVTPSSLQLSAGKDLIATSSGHASVNVVKKFSLAVGEKISLYARQLGLRFIAGQGDMVSQAQRGGMHMLAQQELTLTSTNGKMNASAQQGMQLTCGGGGIRINADGSIEIFSPIGIELKAPNLAYKGPESVKTTAPAFDTGTFQRRFRLHMAGNPQQIMPNRKFRLKNETGEVLEGVTDAEGYSELLDAVDLTTYRMELLP